MQSPDWSTLRHAYGAADDIPALLAHARRAAGPRHFEDEPWLSLWSALCHQGDVYTASYAAVPELVAIADERRAAVRASAECLYLAAMIELERAAPEGLTPPPAVPEELLARYREAISRGATLAEDALRTVDEPEARERFAICVAAFGNDLKRARFLADGPDEAALE